MIHVYYASDYGHVDFTAYLKEFTLNMKEAYWRIQCFLFAKLETRLYIYVKSK